MQIGTRWQTGQQPPAQLPDTVAAAIATAETEHGLTAGAWTLTWLEGRPIATHSDEVRISLRADGTVLTQTGEDAIASTGVGADWAEDDDDDWLS
ncbi:Fe-S oxidoreductase [Gulosibacter chungangensis]|uniref:Fe-S oxidoreductase n=1 Tax=Gulosibacter chungangensis TaxID=979746 RepID=UPI001787B32E|nr:Fe-S oxidoreductase [Gulosibacter chungangensis]